MTFISLEQALDRYIAIQYRINYMKSKDAPIIFIDEASSCLDDIKLDIKNKFGLDIEHYLGTANGQELLHKGLILEYSIEKAADRCHICSHFTLIKGCKKGVMGEKDTYPMTCKLFESSGFEDMADRILNLQKRCSNCKNNTEDEDGLNECILGLDNDEINCPRESH